MWAHELVRQVSGRLRSILIVAPQEARAEHEALALEILGEEAVIALLMQVLICSPLLCTASLIWVPPEFRCVP